jgi:hypothetical protein
VDPVDSDSDPDPQNSCRVVNPGPDSPCYEIFTGKNAVMWMMPIRIQFRLFILRLMRIRIRDLLQVKHKLEPKFFFFYLFTAVMVYMVLSFSSVS